MNNRAKTSSRYLSRILRSLPFKVSSWKLMHRGAWHDVYLLKTDNRGELLMKIPKKAFETWNKKLKVENRILKRLASQPKCFAPHTVYADFSKKTVPFSFQILEFIHGKNIKLVPADLCDLAIQMRSLHKNAFIQWGGFPPRKKKFTFDEYLVYRFSAQVNRLPKGAQKRLSPIFKHIQSVLRYYQCRQNFCITHGDVNTRNILRTKEGDLKFIDWEAADICPPPRDLVDFFVIERFSKERRISFLKIYGDSSKQMKNEIYVFEKLAIFAEFLDDLEMGKDVMSALQKKILTPLLSNQ